MNKKSKKFNQQNTIFVKRGHTLLFSRYNCGNTKEECPRFTTPEFCPVTVLLPESLDTFSILPLRLLFFLNKRKGLSCYLHTGYDIKFNIFVWFVIYNPTFTNFIFNSRHISIKKPNPNKS